VPESAQDLGSKVLVVVRERAVGRRSEAAGERRHYALWTLRDGKVIRMRVYHDRSDAIHAAEPEDQAISANVHLVRSIYADWERGDWSSADWADPRVEFVAADGPWAGSFIGKPAMARAWRQYLDAWEDVRASPDEFRDLGDGRVLALHTWSARGKASGLAVERMQARSAVLLHVADGKVRKLVAYQDRDRALADLGQE
jgi:ketosteroid isomerase-like protein